MINRSANQIMIDAIVSEVDSLLDTCTPEQQARFKKIFPLWPEVDLDIAKSALALVQRTCNKNQGNF